MDMYGKICETSFSLLVIIVNRGKGSKVLEFARDNGAKDASCLFGKGTVRNKFLKFMELDEVDKEIILIVIPSEKSDQVVLAMNEKFHFERPNHGIAFTVPMSGVFKIKCDPRVHWDEDRLVLTDYDYFALILIVDKDKGENVVNISQDAGYYGGTIIKARGSQDKINKLFNMIVEPEKEAVFMILKRDGAEHLSHILNEKLHLDQPNTGFLIKMGVDHIVGLFKNTVDIVEDKK